MIRVGLTTEHIQLWLQKTNEKIQENKTYLTELDQAIGDGDHGINMSRGFEEAIKKTADSDYESPGDLLKDWAMTLISKVGGASGPLFGTAILKMSMSVKGKAEVNYAELTTAFEEALAGILQRGHAAENQKTLVDVWSPVVRFLQENTAFDPAAFSNQAKEAMEQTKDMQAEKGRAAYLKERSIGHLDPGSVSSFYLLQSLSEVIEKEGVTL